MKYFFQIRLMKTLNDDRNLKRVFRRKPT